MSCVGGLCDHLHEEEDFEGAIHDVEYEPYEYQVAFHSGPEEIRLASGGVRSGKTFAGAHEAFFLAMENPGCEGAIVAPTSKMLHSIALKEFRRILDQFPGLVVGEDKSKEFCIYLANGSTVYYRSADSPKSLDGLTLAWFWADELRHWKRESWEILVARLSCPRASYRAGIATSTPRMNWMYEEFHNPEFQDERGIYFFPTHGNKALHKSYKKRLLATISKARYEEYVEGRFGAGTGGVFPDFNLDKHCLHSGVEYDPHHPVIISFDPGRIKASFVFAQHYRYCHQHGCADCVHVFDEWHPDRLSVDKIVPQLVKMVRERGWDVERFFIDKAGNTGNQERNESSVDLLEEMGFFPEWVTSKVDVDIGHGIDLINRKLENSYGECSLFFAPHLKPGGKDDRGVVKAVQRSEFPDTKPGKTESEDPTKDGFLEHSRDALRYLLVNLFPYGGDAIAV